MVALAQVVRISGSDAPDMSLAYPKDDYGQAAVMVWWTMRQRAMEGGGHWLGNGWEWIGSLPEVVKTLWPNLHKHEWEAVRQAIYIRLRKSGDAYSLKRHSVTNGQWGGGSAVWFVANQYQEANYIPDQGDAAESREPSQALAPKLLNEEVDMIAQSPTVEVAPTETDAPVKLVSYTFPLRPGVMVQVQFPEDLTEADLSRLTAFGHALMF